jgi:hypothetical protein
MLVVWGIGGRDLGPEKLAAIAGLEIDRRLEAADWDIKHRADANLSAARGVAELESAVATKQKGTEYLRIALLKSAFEGCLVPTEQELARAERRTFESAAQLLARIQAERPTKPKAKRAARAGATRRKAPRRKAAAKALFKEAS